MTRFKRRIGRGGFVAFSLAPSLMAAILLALLPRERYLVWWLPILQLAPPMLVATLIPAMFLFARRHNLPPIQPHERRVATVAIVLVIAGALIPPIGTAVLTIATGDFRLALSLSVTIGFLVRLGWVLIARHALREPVPSAT